MQPTRWCLTSLCFVGLVVPLYSQNDSQSKPEPVVSWHFEGKPEPGIPKNIETLLEIGPTSPNYPSFPEKNRALTFGAKNSGIIIKESELPKTNLRFKKGESITLESWVKVGDLKEGTYAYIVGKGRNGKAGYPEKNQNYAVRLKVEKGVAKLSFLFGSEPEKEKAKDNKQEGEKSSEWHRWTTDKGIPLAGWHHVAIVYTFGNPKSIRGYLDGESVSGTWDMGGATTRAPISDDDDLVLGTGNGGGAGNSFKGSLDNLIIWRTALEDQELRNRYQFIPPPPVVKKADIPKGQILVQICEEGLPQKNAWPELSPVASETYTENHFGFFAIPQKYTDTGVRADRGIPYLLRASALVTLPKGKHRILLRGLGACRLYIDEKLLITTPFSSSDGSGHGGIVPVESYLNLGDDFRLAPAGHREKWVHFTSDGSSHLVTLETIAGGYLGKNKRRAELGETVVAISEESTNRWDLLSPSKERIPYSDIGWEKYEAERGLHYAKIDAARRESLRKSQEVYWQKRREGGQEWLKGTPEIIVPNLPKGYPAKNPIDHFLAARIETIKGQQKPDQVGGVDYFKTIQPLLEAKCYSCHTGGKAKGGLRLDDFQHAQKGGKNDGPAITPKNLDKSALLGRVRTNDTDLIMPPKGEKLTKSEIETLEKWIREGASWPELNAPQTRLTDLCDDLTFLRRITLDLWGVVPSLEEIREFQADKRPEKRKLWIDKLLTDPRCADASMGYWLDVLAENPNILNPTLNNTGPFRWWIYESLLDNKPLDLFVTELVRMKGSERFGGPAGFGVASQNDVPMATKGTILSTAFLGIEMKCARCHDAPAHSSTQEQLFQVGAMLAAKPLKVPPSSSVPLDKIHDGGRKPLIAVTLKPGTEVVPKWPFANIVSEELAKKFSQYPEDSRDRLATLITLPQNERFAMVMSNRIWARYMGRGLVESIDDWERGSPTHPELLKWLARELVRSGYDTHALIRLILNSHAYQRKTDPTLKETSVLFVAPAHRRLAAEQIVDSLFVATGKPFRLEEMSLDIDNSRDLGNSISLGKPRRSWMLTSTSNERDRPSLALPRIQAVIDVLQAFGWRATRQDPITNRESSANVLQPAILQNGSMGLWLTRLSDDHGVTSLALKDLPLEDFLDTLFLKMLTRLPSDAEKKKYTDYLREGYQTRLTNKEPTPSKRVLAPYVSWSNHLHPEATTLRQKEEEKARAGDPPTTRLEAKWRDRLEDVVWILVTSTEFVLTP